MMVHVSSTNFVFRCLRCIRVQEVEFGAQVFLKLIRPREMNKWPVIKFLEAGAVLVAQLVEQLLPVPEIRGSNSNIGKVLSTNCKLNRKDENKEKEAVNGPSF